jgi:general secretion pathway protein E
MVTLEDPIELELPFATQTQIHPKSGMTFAGTLRSVLRQDPNVLMVGEIRDKETAEIATQAGLTGHLILTTVHGQSSAGVFARLVEMGIEPFLLASSTLGCVSQRLARALCPACRKETPVEPIVRERFEAVGVTIPAGTYFDAKGCESCDFRGFVGRVAVVELLVMDEELRAAVNARMPSPDLARLAEKRGMVSLLSDGIDRAKRGETSLMEVLRVAG